MKEGEGRRNQAVFRIPGLSYKKHCGEAWGPLTDQTTDKAEELVVVVAGLFLRPPFFQDFVLLCQVIRKMLCRLTSCSLCAESGRLVEGARNTGGERR